MKVPLFFLKNAWGASNQHIYIFFKVPLRGHFLHTSPAPISISFFCLFTQTQLHKNQSEPNKIFVFFHFSLHLNTHVEGVGGWEFLITYQTMRWSTKLSCCLEDI